MIADINKFKDQYSLMFYAAKLRIPTPSQVPKIK